MRRSLIKNNSTTNTQTDSFPKNFPLVFGEVLFDEFVQSENEPKKILGGAPFNVAWNLSKFGFSPRLVSAVGDDDNGREILQTMQENQMPLDFVSHSSLPSGSVKVTLQNGEPNYEIVDQVAYDDIAISQEKFSLLSNALNEFQQTSLIYHGSLALRHKKNSELLQRLSRQTSLPIFFDVNLRSPWYEKKQIQDQIQHAHWLKLNIEEFNFLFFPLVFSSLLENGNKEQKKETQEKIFRIMQEYQLENILLTGDKHGAAIFTKRQMFVHGIVPVKNFQDAVGAGDAFSSIFLAGILLKKPTEQILFKALEFASHVCSINGAVSRDEKFYNDIVQNWIQA